MNRTLFFSAVCALMLGNIPLATAQQGYEATQNDNGYANPPAHRFGYWRGVQLLVPFNLPPEREEIALSLWVQLMDICPECRTAYSGHHQSDQYGRARPHSRDERPRDGRHYQDGPGYYDDRYPPANGAPSRAGQGYGQGYDAVLRGQNRSVTIPASEYQELMRKAQAFDQAQQAK